LRPRLRLPALNCPHPTGSDPAIDGVFRHRGHPMNTSDTILVVGSAGRIGQAVVSELKSRGLSVRGFDCRKTPGLDDSLVGDITDAEAVKRAATGVGTLIHLAATPDDDDDFLGRLLPNNITGVYHIMESARQTGVRRLVLASSGQVNWWQRLEDRLP